MVDIGESIGKGFMSWWSAIGVMLLLAAVYGLVAGGFAVGTHTIAPDIDEQIETFAYSDTTNPNFTEYMDMFRSIFTTQLVSFLAISIIVQSILSTLLTAIAIMYLRKKDLNLAFQNGLNKLGGLIALSILLMVSVILGFIFFIIPGIILGIYFSLSLYAFILRQKGPVDAMKYSMKLVTNNWWRTLGNFLVFVICAYLVALLISLLLGVPQFVMTLFAPTVVSKFFSGFANAFSTLLQTTVMYAMGLYYFLGLEKEKGITPVKKKK